ncbi:meiotic cell division protein pelota [Perkinsela sp. CCAP 1560/4]|nr:meiotic cell division protein pelota [Perkinsela sp. CCAP 1560/4]|eukprot:KNH05662.1 meiotic cell division protein pelota [Perkinsela sp. CCAP 1560/4]
MRLIKKEISSDGSGRVSLVPQETNDLWYIFRILNEGNTLRTRTIRKVVKENSSGATTSAERKVITIILKVSRIEYDPAGGSLRVSGQNIGENEFIRLGQFHSTDVLLDAQISIGKSSWDNVDRKLIEESCDASLNADVAAVILDDSVAHLYLVTANMCIEKSTIHNSAAKKKYAGPGSDAKQQKFFKQIMQSMTVHVNSEKVRAIIVASPGSTNTQFVECMRGFHEGDLGRLAGQNKSKVLTCRVGSATTDALKEAFDDPGVLKRLGDTKFAQEIKNLNMFLKKMISAPEMVAYGYKCVRAACSNGAVETLLVSDSLTESMGRHRTKVSALMEEVQSYGGTVHTLSSMHASGKQLEKYTGIAALLRFACADAEMDDPSGVDPAATGIEKLAVTSKKGEYHTCYDGKMLVKGK